LDSRCLFGKLVDRSVTLNDFSSFTTNICCSGLQGSWNAFATKRNIHVPHGEVIIFALAYVTLFFRIRSIQPNIYIFLDLLRFSMLTCYDEIPFLKAILFGQSLVKKQKQKKIKTS